MAVEPKSTRDDFPFTFLFNYIEAVFDCLSNRIRIIHATASLFSVVRVYNLTFKYINMIIACCQQVNLFTH